jgi:hypothetical protein
MRERTWRWSGLSIVVVGTWGMPHAHSKADATGENGPFGH